VKPTILIVEDDPKIAALVAKNLGAAGYDTAVVGDGDAAWPAFERHAPVLVVLDLGLPGTSGLEVARQVRAAGATPILILSARSSESDKVPRAGARRGRLPHPSHSAPRNWSPRVRALLRRTGVSSERALTVGPFAIDPARREVTKDGARIDVTTLEFDLVHFLASRAGQVFSRDALMEHVWGTDRVVGERSIDNLMSRPAQEDRGRPRPPALAPDRVGRGLPLFGQRAMKQSLFWKFAGVFLLVVVVATALQAALSLGVLRPLATNATRVKAQTAVVESAVDLRGLGSPGDFAWRNALHRHCVARRVDPARACHAGRAHPARAARAAAHAAANCATPSIGAHIETPALRAPARATGASRAHLGKVRRARAGAEEAQPPRGDAGPPPFAPRKPLSWSPSHTQTRDRTAS